ncbi:hypothetical protein G7K_4561-t2 [Saitoella complicata NRRL Y-17804]|uniref:Domain of unknown function at the cortex 1 domain-containing protein n=1 Tax=Saitoella complicata (strain BCRC 22490 / CBS 7301 / JCM 7358 / NBRC 10748 / NRRL Y-17804) TaxID=698492 RepID=A0A0E9NM01_SAICN|nr:hypothetical protein G7K_4561-t2 [Saitoella complicata NRRL Y-17804]
MTSTQVSVSLYVSPDECRQSRIYLTRRYAATMIPHHSVYPRWNFLKSHDLNARKDSEPFFPSVWSNSLLGGRDGRSIGAVLEFRDVTEEREMEKERIQAMVDVEQGLIRAPEAECTNKNSNHMIPRRYIHDAPDRYIPAAAAGLVPYTIQPWNDGMSSRGRYVRWQSAAIYTALLFFRQAGDRLTSCDGARSRRTLPVPRPHARLGLHCADIEPFSSATAARTESHERQVRLRFDLTVRVSGPAVSYLLRFLLLKFCSVSIWCARSIVGYAVRRNWRTTEFSAVVSKRTYHKQFVLYHTLVSYSELSFWADLPTRLMSARTYVFTDRCFFNVNVQSSTWHLVDALLPPTIKWRAFYHFLIPHLLDHPTTVNSPRIFQPKKPSKFKMQIPAIISSIVVALSLVSAVPNPNPGVNPPRSSSSSTASKNCAQIDGVVQNNLGVKAMDQSNLKLKVSAGASKDCTKLTLVSVNDDDDPTKILGPHFDGELVVRIRDFTGVAPNGKQPQGLSDYFMGTQDTFSLQWKGRFKGDWTADDIVFGNDFDHPIKDSLPTSTSLGLKALSWIDPTLETDLYGNKPWALSPLLSTMNIINASPCDEAGGALHRITEDASALTGEQQDAAARRTWFANQVNRKKTTIPEDMTIQGDFSNPFVDFKSISAHLPYVNLNISILQYWDGQPLRYVCRTRNDQTIFFVVLLELVDDEGQNVGPEEVKED